MHAWAAIDEIKEVFVATAKKTVLVDEKVFPGIVQSRVHSKINPQFGSIVEKLIVPLGATVKKGQRIVKVSNQDRSLSYKSSYIEAPVNGVISWYGVHEGSFVGPSDTVAIITNPNKLFVKLEVPIKDLRQIALGLSGELVLESLGGVVPLKVSGVGALVDSITGTVPVELDITEKASQKLYAGQIGKVKFKFDSTPLFLVKDSAVKMVGNETFIQLIQDKKVKKVKVQLGNKTNGQSVVLSGLEEGMTYVERSSGHLSDGDQVKVVEKM